VLQIKETKTQLESVNIPKKLKTELKNCIPSSELSPIGTVQVSELVSSMSCTTTHKHRHDAVNREPGL